MTNGEQEIDRLRRRRGWESGGPLEQISQATDTAVVSEAFFAGPAVCCGLRRCRRIISALGQGHWIWNQCGPYSFGGSQNGWAVRAEVNDR
jgi:hypothetical protein